MSDEEFILDLNPTEYQIIPDLGSVLKVIGTSLRGGGALLNPIILLGGGVLNPPTRTITFWGGVPTAPPQHIAT